LTADLVEVRSGALSDAVDTLAQIFDRHTGTSDVLVEVCAEALQRHEVLLKQHALFRRQRTTLDGVVELLGHMRGLEFRGKLVDVLQELDLVGLAALSDLVQRVLLRADESRRQFALRRYGLMGLLDSGTALMAGGVGSRGAVARLPPCQQHRRLSW
jgi:hypothetical protein